MRISRSQFVFDADSQDVGKYNLLVATCGYESRSSAVASEHADGCEAIVAFSYPEQRSHSYDENLGFFSSIGEVRHPGSLDDFERELRTIVGSAIRGKLDPVVAVDISSVSRDRLGAIVRVLGDIDTVAALRVVFLYSVATYDSHDAVADSTIIDNGPIRGFEGWTGRPSDPVACLIGLGFENLIALAALETLEPARTVAFVATSADPRFKDRVDRDNAAILRSAEVSIVPYAIEDAFSALHSLEGVVHALEDDYRVVLVPLGPKIFALLCLLVAWEYRDSVAVWRVSADFGARVVDRKASGQFISFPVRVQVG